MAESKDEVLRLPRKCSTQALDLAFAIDAEATAWLKENRPGLVRPSTRRAIFAADRSCFVESSAGKICALSAGSRRPRSSINDQLINSLDDERRPFYQLTDTPHSVSNAKSLFLDQEPSKEVASQRYS
jgi:hypothetical protein